MKEKKNFFVRGAYFTIMAWILTQIVGKKNIVRVTRKSVLDFCKSLGMSDTAANATTTVILSPTRNGERGDCRGNTSAPGHLYFFDRIKPKEGDMIYEYHTRIPALEPHRRKAKNAQEGTEPAKKAKAKAKPAKTPKAKANQPKARKRNRPNRKPAVKVVKVDPTPAEPAQQEAQEAQTQSETANAEVTNA
jgi:hypothetical protein